MFLEAVMASEGSGPGGGQEQGRSPRGKHHCSQVHATRAALARLLHGGALPWLSPRSAGTETEPRDVMGAIAHRAREWRSVGFVLVLPGSGVLPEITLLR